MGFRFHTSEEKVSRQILQSLLEHIDLRQIRTIDQLCEAFARRRQQPIHLRFVSFPASITGAWVAKKDGDVICVAQDATSSLRDQIVCHELIHISLNHHSLQDDDMLRQIFPDLDWDTVYAVLKRSSYDMAEERQAEYIGSLLKQTWYDLRPADSTFFDMGHEPGAS